MRLTRDKELLAKASRASVLIEFFGCSGAVTEQHLYQLIRQLKRIADRQFEIEFLDSGVEAFAFTFG